MSADGRKDAPPYMLPVDGQSGGGIKVYNLHSPFTPPESQGTQLPVYTGGMNSSAPDDSKNKFVSYDTALGFNPGMTSCPSCNQQVMSNVTYKAGRYAWLMCLLFICLGLVLCCCLIPFFMNKFKDAYHTCPRCNRVLHVEKRKCCK